MLGLFVCCFSLFAKHTQTKKNNKQTNQTYTNKEKQQTNKPSIHKQRKTTNK
jgi:hypothetical protein